MRYPLLAIVSVCALAVSAAAQQSPASGAKNLQYFPKDISRDALIQRMRGFSLALDVRCQYCHAGGDGVSFDGVDFASDEKPAKNKARAMLRMTDEINATLLPRVPSRAEPRVEVTCVTCHRGLALPKSLQTTLFETIARDGVAAAVAQYRELRNTVAVAGKYSFDEWEINELARRLAESNNPKAAIAMLEMNGEFYPKSGAIDFQIAELYFNLGDKDKALARYRASLEKAPTNARAKARIAEIENKQPGDRMQ